MNWIVAEILVGVVNVTCYATSTSRKREAMLECMPPVIIYCTMVGLVSLTA
jgi:hypothetical protein